MRDENKNKEEKAVEVKKDMGKEMVMPVESKMPMQQMPAESKSAQQMPAELHGYATYDVCWCF
jgi:recombination DNA repair RAD52 pathway protein